MFNVLLFFVSKTHGFAGESRLQNQGAPGGRRRYTIDDKRRGCRQPLKARATSRRVALAGAFFQQFLCGADPLKEFIFVTFVGWQLIWMYKKATPSKV